MKELYKKMVSANGALISRTEYFVSDFKILFERTTKGVNVYVGIRGGNFSMLGAVVTAEGVVYDYSTLKFMGIDRETLGGQIDCFVESMDSEAEALED